MFKQGCRQRARQQGPVPPIKICLTGLLTKNLHCPPPPPPDFGLGSPDLDKLAMPLCPKHYDYKLNLAVSKKL